MKDQTYKQIYSYIMLGVTLAWAVFAVIVTYRAVTNLSPVDVMAASGVNVLLGSLVAWNGNIVQFFYRKAIDETTKPS